MGVAVIFLLINIISTQVKGVRVGNDPWGDGRTIEWAIPSPPPFYNFKQTPLIRGLDAYWLEKMEGKDGLTPAEPIGDIHMPNNSIIPLIVVLGLFIAAFGAMYHVDDKAWALPVLIIGMLITLGAMFFRSVLDDHGYHVHKEDLLDDDDKGGKA